MKKILIFLTGAALSGALGYGIGITVAKKKYEHLADEEVASVKKSLKEHYEKKDIKPEKPAKEKTKIALTKKEPIDIVKGTKLVDTEHTDYGKQYRTASGQERIPGSPGEDVKAMKKEEVDTTKPYIITPEDFHDSEYEAVTIYYCADKVLIDNDYNEIKNVGIVGGYSILDQIGKYDADCLYVRDTKNGIDYEILVEERPFSQIRPMGSVREE